MNDELIRKFLADTSELNRFREEITKAAETIATSTFSPADRSVFSPENLDEEIKILVPTSTSLRNILPRVPGKGEAAAWKKLTSRLHAKNQAVAGGVGTNTSIAFADAGAPNETSQTYAAASAAYKLLGRKVEVGGLANAASGGRGLTMLEERERVKMIEVMIGEEELIIQGDSAYNAYEFDGLLKGITTYSGTLSLLTVSGLNTYNQTLADKEGAYAQYLVATAFQINALANALQGSGSINRILMDPQGGATGGLALKQFVNSANGSAIQVLHNRYMGANALLLTPKSEAGENWIEMEDLIPMSRVDVPSSNFSFIRFIIEATVLKLIGEPFQYKIGGLATS